MAFLVEVLLFSVKCPLQLMKIFIKAGFRLHWLYYLDTQIIKHCNLVKIDLVNFYFQIQSCENKKIHSST